MAFREDDLAGQFRYLEGYVELRVNKDTYQKVFCILNANTLSFYEKKRTQRELERIKPMEVANLTFKKTSFKVDELKLTVKNASRLNTNSDLKLRFTTTEERDNWYIRLFSLCYGAPPTDIPLLPGQIQIANDILQLEAKRCARRMSAPAVSYPDEPPSTPPPDPPRQRRVSDSNRHSHPSEKDQFNLTPPGHTPSASFPPKWFFGKIPRHHAEQILKDNQRFGDLLVRASESTRGPGEFSLSVRQSSRDGHAVIRHYKLIRMLTSSGLNGYKLDIDEHHEVKNSVYELLLFFIEKSGGSLKLFETQDSSLLKMPDNLYENRFSEIFSTDPENGEHPRSPSHGSKLPMHGKGSFIRNQRAPWTPEESEYLAPDVKPGAPSRHNAPPLPKIREEGNSKYAGSISKSFRK